tara:strand:- start:6508 stop:9495 length:2988 start_codon:yes stop_codon:yes gene_type:complete
MATKLTNHLQLEEMSAPTAEDNNGVLYVKADGNLYFKSAGGSGGAVSETQLGAASVSNHTDNRVITSTGTGLNGEANLTFDGSKLAVAGEISGSGVLNIVGAATLESTLSVTGAIGSAAGVSGSSVSASYAHFNSLGLNQGGTNSITMGADGTITTTGKFATSGEISGSGVLNIVGAATLESTLSVTGAIGSAAGLSGSSVSASYAHFNSFGLNQGGTNSITMGGDGTITTTGKFTTSGEISGSGDLNIVGAATLESTLSVTGAIGSAAGLSGSSVSASYGHFNSFGINDGGTNSLAITGDGKLSTTGEISSSGPLNIGANSHLFGYLHVTGAILSADNISSSLGALAAKSVTFGHAGNSFLNAGGGAELQGNLYVSGNLVINGTTTTVNSTTVTVDDPIFTLGGDTAPGSDDNKDRGIEFRYHDGSSARVGFMGWDDSAEAFTLLHTATNSSEVFSGTEATLKAGQISGSGELNIVGAATLESTLSVTGAIGSAAGLSGSSVSASYAHVNNLAVNDGGTKSVRANGDGTLVIAGQAAGTTCLSASGDANIVGNVFIEGDLGVSGTFALSSVSSSGPLDIVGAATLESTLHVSGAISGAVGMTGSSLYINDTSKFHANGNAEIPGALTLGGALAGSGKISTSGEISGSGVLNIVGATTLESTLNVSGNVTLGNATSNTVTVTGQLTASEGMLISDLAQLRFGTTGDIATIKYNSASGQKNLYVTLPPNGMMLAATGTNEPLLSITSLHADATAGALQLCHFPNDNSAADDDVLGNVIFKGYDSGNSVTTYGKIIGYSADVTNGTEDGKIGVNITIGGGDFEVAAFGTTGLTLPNTSSHGLVTAHSFVTYSDERLKENIKRISNPIDKVKALRGVTYDWRHDGSEDIGFIAQEVQEVVPSVVYEKKGYAKEHFGLDYPKMNALLVEAIKEQQRQIEDLKKVVKGLKNSDAKETNKVKKRTCSKCGKEGHDKRSCAKIKAESKSKFERAFMKAKNKK